MPLKRQGILLVKKLLIGLMLVSTSTFAFDIFEFGYDFKFNAGCKRYTTTKQCFSKQVCETVCDGYGLANPPGGLACRQVCKLIPECHDVIVCVEYY